MTSEEIFDKVKATLIEALGADEEEVTPKATLIGDLGAESIDFLDIIFRLEKNFAIKIQRSDLFPEDLAADKTLVQDGKITAAGVAVMRQRLVHVDKADFDKFAADPRVDKILDLFTVQMMVNYLKTRLG